MSATAIAEYLKKSFSANYAITNRVQQTEVYKLKEKIYKQAARHTSRDFPNEIIELKRPYETPQYRAYRKDNRRSLSYAGVDSFIKILLKSLRYSLIDLNKLPAELKNNMKYSSYRFMNTEVDFQTFVFAVVIQQSLLDANAMTVELPFIKDRPTVSPLNLNSGEDLHIKTKIFHYNEYYVHRNPDFLVCYLKGYRLPGSKVDYTYAYVADNENWYIYKPYAIGGGDNKVEYTLELWYPHDYGSLPYSMLPGVNATDKNGEYYQENFIRSYFEFADEFDSRFQDDQVIHARYAFPREVIDPVACVECNGSGRKVIDDENVQCPECKGAGYIASDHISGRIVRPKSLIGVDTKDPISFITPDVGILDHSTYNAFFFLEEGRKSIGLDVLLPGREATETVEIREENKLDILLNYNHQLIRWQIGHLNQRLCLLTRNAQKISIDLPIYIPLKSERAFSKELKEALLVDRYSLYESYIQQKYSNDAIRQRIHMLSAVWAPLVLLNQDEIKLRLDSGVYLPIDLLKADKAVYIFTVLSKETNFGIDDEMFKKADILFNSLFINNNQIV